MTPHMTVDLTKGLETTQNIHMPGNHPKERIEHSEHGENLT